MDWSFLIVYKSKNKNVWIIEQKRQLSFLWQNYEPLKLSKNSLISHFYNTSARTPKGYKLEPIKDISEVQNQYFQDGYIPGSCMKAVEQLVAFRGIHFKTRWIWNKDLGLLHLNYYQKFKRRFFFFFYYPFILIFLSFLQNN